MIEQPDVREVADQPANEQPAATFADNDQVSELAQARERLSFYESFDSLIRDNVLRSGELLRQVAAERERTDQQVLAMQTDLDQRLAEQRSTLAEIATGLAGLQANLVTIVDRVEASLVELRSPPGGIATGNVAVTGDSESVKAVATTTRLEDNEKRIALSVATEVDDPARREGFEPVVPVRRTIDVIVHGVPKAATALSLQRHLQELRGVETVDVREYVSGVLRFQMVATEFGPDDLRHWPGADGLQTVTSRDNVLELRLVTDDGF